MATNTETTIEQQLLDEHENLMREFDGLHQRLGALERRDFISVIQVVPVDERIAIDAAHGIWREDKAAWRTRWNAWMERWDHRNG